MVLGVDAYLYCTKKTQLLFKGREKMIVKTKMCFRTEGVWQAHRSLYQNKGHRENIYNVMHV